MNTEEYVFEDFDAQDLKQMLDKEPLFQGVQYEVREGSLRDLTGEYVARGGPRTMICGDHVGNALADSLGEDLENRIFGVVIDFALSKELVHNYPQYASGKPVIFFPLKYNNS